MSAKWIVNLRYSPSEMTWLQIPPPPGFDSNIADADSVDEAGSAVITAEQQMSAKQSQVYAMAYAPGKNLLSTAFMLWMSGSSIQIFSIMMTGMALINPLKAIAGINATFEKFKGDDGVDLRIPKLMFLSLQILSLGVALYKTHTMGLLPVTSADWTSYIPDKHFLEVSSIPI